MSKSIETPEVETIEETAPAAEGDEASDAPKVRVALTPEQHERKLQRDRESRAARSRAKTAAGAAEDAAREKILDEGRTQAERDVPYQQKLSASLRLQDKARARSLIESQQRQAEIGRRSARR